MPSSAKCVTYAQRRFSDEFGDGTRQTDIEQEFQMWFLFLLLVQQEQFYPESSTVKETWTELDQKAKRNIIAVCFSWLYLPRYYLHSSTGFIYHPDGPLFYYMFVLLLQIATNWIHSVCELIPKEVERRILRIIIIITIRPPASPQRVRAPPRNCRPAHLSRGQVKGSVEGVVQQSPDSRRRR